MNTQHIVSTVIALGLSSLVVQAQADVVVVVGARSAVGSLTKTQISDLYMGRSKDFPNGDVALTTMISNSPSKDEFLLKVLGKTDSQARSVWARLTFTGAGSGPRELSDANEFKKLAASNPNVIGFIDKSALDAQVKVVFDP